MNKRYLLTQFFVDATGHRVPVCSAYGARWFCPRCPSSPDGWALVLIDCLPQQIEAAKLDPRVCVIPEIGAIPQSVVAAYSAMGAKAGMGIQDLLAKLAEVEPLFLSQG